LRHEDLIFRTGGDEFAILMPELTIGQAEDICHGLRGSLSVQMNLNGIDACVGASFGLSRATFGLSCGETMRAADEALYQAKARGRGRVVVSSSCRTATPKVVIGTFG
jgi:diguanylate cyclase (GGDEF)-like protein